MLIQGDADAVYVPTQYYQSMAEESGIKVSEDLDTLNVEGIHFNYEIQAQDNPLVGSGQLDGNGVPSDFFQDRNVRLGFAHAMDQETLINEALNGFGRNPVTPVPYGIPFKDTELESRAHDIEAATEAFKKAHGGQVWEQGFQLEILYNEGNDRRQLTARILAENINSINDKFNVTTRAVPWADYLDRIRNSTMPVFIIGWAPDYPDPDNYVTPFMHSTKGTFAAWAHYENKEVDQLIDEAGTTLDADRREEIYYQLQETYLEEIVSVMTNQQVEQRYYRDWVEGNFYNPMQADPFELLPHIEKSS
jgi:peptide/nickel transport system substrate-binding protein